MIIYKLRFNASLKGSKAKSAPLLACGYCSLMEGVLVPRGICISAINGIFCLDRRGMANKAIQRTQNVQVCITALFASSYRKQPLIC